MIRSTISQHPAIVYPLAAFVFTYCFWSVPGVCPACHAAGADGFKLSIVIDREDPSVATPCQAALWPAGGDSVKRVCLCCQLVLKGPVRSLIQRRDPTGSTIARGLFASLPNVARDDRHARLVWRTSPEVGLLSAAQQRAFRCRFLL